MGVAEVIPGVSGGTIAFITGIYETLIKTVKSIDLDLIKLIFQFKLKDVWTKLNGSFLAPLVVGMLFGIITGVFGATHLMENYPEALWALFFGLILASVPYMLNQVKNKKVSLLLPFVIGAFIAYMVTSLSPAEGSLNYVYIFFAGMIAISAFVLPGISGSFMLLLMGLYTVIIPTLKAFFRSPEVSEFVLLAVFGLGCIAGLGLFSRLVSAAFEKYHDITIAIMSGFMLGSLNKIWPWRNPALVLDKEEGVYTEINSSNILSTNFNDQALKIISETKVLPEAYFSDPKTLLVIISFLIGLTIIYLLFLSQRKA